jgi:hypothetical protein
MTQPYLSFSEDVYLLTGSLKGEVAGMLVYHNRIKLLQRIGSNFVFYVLN